MEASCTLAYAASNASSDSPSRSNTPLTGIDG
jgi:hypothetical protein